MRLSVASTVILALGLPASADVVLLKRGQRIEGEVVDKGAAYEIKTDSVTLEVAKAEVEKIVKSVEAIKAEADELHQRARAFYNEALEIQNDPPAANAKLKAGLELLRKVGDLYNQAVETYTDEKYAYLSKDLVKVFQEMRLYRDKMASEIAGPSPAPPSPKPEENPEPAPPSKSDAPPMPAPSAKKKKRPEPKVPETGPKDTLPSPKPQVDVAPLLAQAKTGDVEAMYALGAAYDEREWNGTEASKWLKSAAEKNHPKAQARLGCLYLEGKGVKPDLKEAQKWFLKGDSRGNVLAQFQLGRMHYLGRGYPKSISKANAWCEKASWQLRRDAENGDPEALCALGWMCVNGIGIELNPGQGVAYYREAADQGHIPAQYDLGVLYDKGEGGVQNWDEAAAWMRLAADQGFVEAQVYLGEMYDDYFYRKRNPHVNFKKAAEWYTKAAAAGHARAQFRLGWYHFDEVKSAARDEAQGVKLFTTALSTANDVLKPAILSDLGFLYERGKGVTKDLKEAMKFYRAAADMGLPMAQHNVGSMYGQPQFNSNYAESVKWFLLAARQGHGNSSQAMGDCYLSGWGVKKDFAEAERWYVAAVQQDSDGALEKLKQLRGALQGDRPKKKP